VQGDKLYLVSENLPTDPERLRALREELVARHLRGLPRELRAAWRDGHHPAQQHARMAEARAHAGDLLREIGHLSYVNEVLATFQPGDRIALSVVLRTTFLPPTVRAEVPWLYRGFETRCLPRAE
jgi:hypothetical protein